MSAVDIWGPFLCWMLLCAWWWLLRRKQRELADREESLDAQAADLKQHDQRRDAMLAQLSDWEKELRARERAVNDRHAAINARIAKQIANAMRSIRFLETEVRQTAGE